MVQGEGGMWHTASVDRSILVAFEGIDGAGKTTLSRNLAAAFHKPDPLITKEPTDRNEWGRRLRRTTKEGRLPKDVEIELFHKDRIDHLKNEIKPNLNKGRIVICDRYIDSTLAYQCEDADEADHLYRQMLPDILVPDITFILSCDVQTGLDRITKRDGPIENAFETYDTLEKARIIFLSRSNKHYFHINSSESVETVLQISMKNLLAEFNFLNGFVISKFKPEGEVNTINTFSAKTAVA